MDPQKLQQKLMGPNVSVPDDLREICRSSRESTETLSRENASKLMRRSKTPNNLEAIHSMRNNKAICQNPSEQPLDGKPTDTKMTDSSREAIAENPIFEESTYYHTSSVKAIRGSIGLVNVAGNSADFKAKSPETMRDIHAILHSVSSAALYEVRALRTGAGRHFRIRAFSNIPNSEASSSDHHASSVKNTSPSTSQVLTTLTPKSPAFVSTISTSSSLILSTPTSSVLTLSTLTEATFLELCVNVGENLKRLGEINLVGAKLDEDMFERIREKYFELRGARSKLWLLKPASVYFVRFSVEQRHRVGTLQTPLSLPPKIEVDHDSWIYHPCPLDEGELPVPENVILHYLKCTSPTGILFWMRRVPRKCKTSILDNGAAPIALGWGIHIDEGPNYKVIFFINFVALVISGIIALAWSLAKEDFQGAFGFASWFIASVNALLLTLMYWLNE
ncbi:uncharacterized protein EAF02_011704 [Botrytis sinoallii]|uniref:uncharacterized protein n=1 Tax=Botrytis sinoallii TaxID=1463999 RepID=UPI001900D06F|nr:uncharacterized protein EAF02_011704 [Botrytis sinoallii]KAF7854529.1 hypothetical protein EAF02_011704 [Botrytis sinoallii]